MPEILTLEVLGMGEMGSITKLILCFFGFVIGGAVGLTIEFTTGINNLTGIFAATGLVIAILVLKPERPKRAAKDR